jgi:hypothetical protein
VYRGLEDDRFHYQKYKGLVTEGVLAGLRIRYRVIERADQLGAVADAIGETAEAPLVLLLRHAALFTETS